MGNTVQIWDIREGNAVRSIYGPHICGDALDIVGDEILTGSWRADTQLEVWSLSTGEKIQDVPWTAGSGANEAKVFDHAKGNSVVGIVTGLSRGIFALDFSPTDNRLAVAGGDSSIRIIDIITKSA